MHGIERRAKEGIYLFTLIHPERYGTIESYRSEKGTFRELVRRLVPGGWTVGEQPGVWSMALPPERRLPDAGFKIHLSITHDRAKELLETVVPIFAEETVCFKVLVDELILDYSNSHMWGRGGSGKFITVYPADVEQFKRLMERLHEATKQFQGPYILSDKRYKDSKVLFYRYGGFKKERRVSVFGEPMATIKTADGREVPDIRLPYFSLPDGVADPFPDSEEDPQETVLNGRYKALGALGVSSKGGVYRCLDLKTNQEVVVKEARPLVNRGRRYQFDAVDCLKNEYRVLKMLEGTGITPQPIDFFQEWEHSFVAMEVASGKHLYRHLASGDFCVILEKDPEAEEVQRYCQRFLAIARKLVHGLRTIHERGVVIQDVSPRNILFDPEKDKITFIDFEAAYAEAGDVRSPIVSIFTPGFGAARLPDKEPTIADDYRALSSILGDFIYPPTPFFSLAPQNKRPMLSHVAKEKGVPEAFVRLIFGAAEEPEKLDELLDEAERSIPGITDVAPPRPLRSDDELKQVLSRIGGYILEQIRTSQDPLDLPTDYRRFITNRLSVAYGMSGIALFLKRVLNKVPPEFLEPLCREAEKIDSSSYAPGLYVGSSGVAWTLLELGRKKEAEALMDTAARSPLLYENADMFYGAAGWGLVNLYFFKQLGDEKYLRNAVAAFTEIRPRLDKDKGGYSYKNTDDVYFGLAHGASGIGYFMLRLYQATRRDEHLEYARGLLDFELASAEEKSEYVMFQRSANDKLYYPYWRIGNAGIGSVGLRFHEVLKDARYLEMARKNARYLAGKYTVFPTNLSGMAGIGNFFVDMYQHTGEKSYLEEARRFIDRIMLFAIEKPAGIVFPGEDLLRISTDYGTGAAGTGIFIDRVLWGGGIPYLDF